MNNEEKILELLTEMRSDIADLKATQNRQGEQLALQGEQLALQGEQLATQGEQLAYLTERVDEIDARSLRSAVLLETEVARDIRLVYEGQELLKQKMETLAPKDRVEALEGDVAMLKDVVKLMRMEINELKKAE